MKTFALPLFTLVFALAAAALPTVAAGQVLAQAQLLTPLAPAAPSKGFDLAAGPKLDPGKPVWVSYSLFAISASDKPRGEIAIGAAPEGVAVPLADATVLFESRKMNAMPATGTLAARMQETVGKQSPEELAARMGPELHAAYQALLDKKGAMLAQTIVKVYPAPGKPELRLTGSIDRAIDIHPAMLMVVMGQGEVPAQYKDAFAGLTGKKDFPEKLVMALISFAIAGFWLYRKFKR